MKGLSGWGILRMAVVLVAAGVAGGGLLIHIHRAGAQEKPAATSTAAATPSSAPRPMRLKPEDFRLVGGWRLAQPFTDGGLAIDFEGKRIFIGGGPGKNEIAEYSFARPNPSGTALEEIPMGKGEDISQWPRLDPVKRHEGFWETGCYAGGLYYKDNRLWASARKFYDMTPPPQFSLSGMDLATGEVTTQLVKLPRAAFGGGFVKGKPDALLLGCGGYESGQGSVSGPTLATPEGEILIDQKNHGTMKFEQRELRPANYWPKDHKEGWTALEPRNGVGRWACDRLRAGGIWNPRGVCYWALLGIGEIDDVRQNETFGATNEVWLYTYDAQTYDKVEFNLWKHGFVIGQEVGPDGLVYLLVRDAWQSGMYHVDPVIKVFEIAK